MEQAIRVAVLGAAGRMGKEVLKALTPAEGFEIIAAVDRVSVGVDARELVGPTGPAVLIQESLGDEPLDAIVDFSHYTVAVANARKAASLGGSSIIGCTGLSPTDFGDLEAIALETGVPIMVVPNFAIGAVLMMKFAEMAAKWIPNVEIIELHHDRKEDAPSGTAMRTAEMIAEARQRVPVIPVHQTEKVEGALGGKVQGVPVHSVRLPGLLAHQQVLFGGPGETLTIRHDSLDRAGFMEGVKLCVRSVKSLNGLVVGMDKILF